MEKQPLQSECFETAFLEYLSLRYEFEPLPHYVMAAIRVCEETSRDYPQFVSGFLAWFADSFFEPEFDRKGNELPLGSYPITSWNGNPLNAQWGRYEDCHELLDGWLLDDLRAALERQEERIELVKRVERHRSEERDDPPGKAGRRRAKSTKTDAEVFADLENWFGDQAHTLRRAYKKIAEPKLYMSGIIPIALVRVGDQYVIETRSAGRGERFSINIPLPKQKKK